MILPVILKIFQSNGETAVIQLPVDVWMRDGIWTFKYASSHKIEKLVLDPDHLLPDINRANNVWTGPR